MNMQLERKIKKVLIVSQVIPQWYVDVVSNALGENTEIDIITGSKIKGNVIMSPEYNSASLLSRFVSWWKYYRFVKKWVSKNKKRNYDLIFAVSNPPINSYIGIQLKKRFHASFFYMNWDLYPQVIEETIKNPFIHLVCRFWHLWNNRNYHKIDNMLTIGDVMAKSINQSLKNPIPVKVLPIAVDTNYLKPIEKNENPFCQANGLTDKFVILYSGKMGLGHNIELILDAAEKLKDEKKICFVFIGGGPKYSIVENHISVHHSENIRLFPFQPDSVFPYSMACGDIGIVAQETKMAHLFMPSKTYSMMACGMAILGIGTNHDDLYKLIQKGKIGISFTKQDAELLAMEIKKLYLSKTKMGFYKNNARNIAKKYFSLSIVERKYRELFEQL